MALKAYGYNCTYKNLLDGDWVGGNVYAQLLSNSYNFSDVHTTRADLSTFTVSSPVPLSNKTTSYSGKETTLDCDDIVVTGSPSARWVAFLFWDGVAVVNSDKLISIVDLNSDGQVDVLVDSNLVISSSGVNRITFSNA